MGFDPGFEYPLVHGRVDDPWRGQPVTAQAGDEGLRFPRAERRIGIEAMTFGCPSCAFGQFGVGRCFINKDQPRQCLVEETPASFDPEITGLGDLRPQLFACLEAFFYGSAQAG